MSTQPPTTTTTATATAAAASTDSSTAATRSSYPSRMSQSSESSSTQAVRKEAGPTARPKSPHRNSNNSNSNSNNSSASAAGPSNSTASPASSSSTAASAGQPAHHLPPHVSQRLGAPGEAGPRSSSHHGHGMKSSGGGGAQSRPTSGSSVDERCPGSDRVSEQNDKTKLHSAWRVYYDIRPVHNARQHSRAENYENNLQPLYEFGTVESFSRLFNHLPPPSVLPVNANYHLFRAHIKPMWEDALNSDGGEFRYTFSRTAAPDVTNAVWREVVMLMVGEQADPEEGICGVVFSKRGKGDRLSIWTRSNVPTTMLDEIQARLTNHLSASHPPPTPAYASKHKGVAPKDAPRHLRGVPIPDLTFEFSKRGGGNICTPLSARPPMSATGKNRHPRGPSANSVETVAEANEDGEH